MKIGLQRLATGLTFGACLLYGLLVFAADVREIPLRVPATGKTGFTLLSPDQTGVAFTNSLNDWASAENRVLNNGSGVAAGDFDNDGWPDLFFCSLNNQNRLYRNLGNWRFADVTAQAGLVFPPGYYRAAVFADLNGDGSLDLLVGMVGKGVLCFLNDGRGHFTNWTIQAGTASAFATESLALADVDGNGTLDLYVANNRIDDVRDWLRIPVMLVNRKPTVPPALRDRLTFENGQVQEYGEPDSFYLNDGQAHFQSVSWTSGKFFDEWGRPLTNAPKDWGLTPAFRDLNGDGLPDLYVCNDYWTPDRIWINTGKGIFRAIPQQAIRKTSASSMGVAFSDVNQDGYLDIFVVDMLSRNAALRKRQLIAKRLIAPHIGDTDSRVQSPQNTLLLNRGDGTYAEVACLAGLQASDWSWSPHFLDVDLDGYEDLLISAGHIRDIQDLDATEKIKSLQDNWRRNASGSDVQRAFVAAKREHTRLYPPLQMPIVAFHNSGHLHFEDVTAAWGLEHPGVNHGMALADLDNDGDLDLIINRLGESAAIYRNDSIAPRISVRLHGKAPNTQAIGARIQLIGGPTPRQQREVVAGGAYLSSSDTLSVFAPGTSTTNLQLRVTWPDGTVTANVKPRQNHLYEITQTDASKQPPQIVPSTRIWFEDVSGWLNHVHVQNPFDDFQRQPLLPRKLSQSGPGVSWFDFNNDGWDDLIIGSGTGGQIAVFENKTGKAFERIMIPAFEPRLSRDQTEILAFHTRSNTMVLAGQSNYEDADTTTSCLRKFQFPLSSWKTEIPDNPFPAHPASIGPMAVTEMNHELWLFAGGQVVGGRYPESTSSLIFRHVNGRWLVDSNNSAFLAHVGPVNGAVWSDLNGDGTPELVLASEWGPIRILRNQAGTLLDITTNFGLAQTSGLWTGITTGDFDEDGKMDIVAGNWGLNSSWKASFEQPLTLVYGDLTGEGRIDILQTEWNEGRLFPVLQRDTLGLPFILEKFSTHTAYSKATLEEVLGDRAPQAKRVMAKILTTTLFLNRGDHFEARELPLEAQIAPVFGIQVADFDGDGHEDLFLSQNFFAFHREEDRCDAGRGLWLRGDGRGKLTPVSGQESGVRMYGEQRGAAVADFDRDGRVDLVVTQNGAATRLYHNVAARPGLRVHLAGPPENPDGIGAVLRLRYGEAWGPARELHAGSGYWSQNSITEVLGISSSPATLRVRWPGGKTFETAIPGQARELTIGWKESLSGGGEP